MTIDLDLMTLVFDFTTIPLDNPAGRKLLNRWLEDSKITEPIDNWLKLTLYSMDKNTEELTELQWLNPMIKTDKYSDEGYKIDFDWVLEDSEDNRNKIIDYVVSRCSYPLTHLMERTSSYDRLYSDLEELEAHFGII